MIAIISFELSLICYGISQLAQHGKLKWATHTLGRKLPTFWESDSWMLKYKRDDSETMAYHFVKAPNNWYYRINKDLAYKERFPLSGTLLVWTTDGYHLCQALFFIFLSVGISLSLEVQFYWIWPSILLLHFMTRKLLSK